MHAYNTISNAETNSPCAFWRSKLRSSSSNYVYLSLLFVLFMFITSTMFSYVQRPAKGQSKRMRERKREREGREGGWEKDLERKKGCKRVCLVTTISDCYCIGFQLGSTIILIATICNCYFVATNETRNTWISFYASMSTLNIASQTACVCVSVRVGRGQKPILHADAGNWAFSFFKLWVYP